MRTLKAIIFIPLILAICSTVQADSGNITGKIAQIRIIDPSNEIWAPPRFWFSLEGVTDAGSCGKYDPVGGPIFVGNTNEAYSAILAAYHSGGNVAVYYNSNSKVLDFCVAQRITLGNPPVN